MTPAMAARLVAKPLYFGGMMVQQGDARRHGRGRRQSDAARDRGRPDDGRPRRGIALPSSYFLIVVPDFLGRRSALASSSPTAR